MTSFPADPGEPTRADLLAQVAVLQGSFASLAAIEQAKGALMVTYGITADAAFDLLRFHSQTRNVKLRAIATELTALLSTNLSSAAAIDRFDRLIDTVTNSLQTPSNATAQTPAPGPPVSFASLLSPATGDQTAQPPVEQVVPPPGVTIAGNVPGLPLVYVNHAFTELTGTRSVTSWAGTAGSYKAQPPTPGTSEPSAVPCTPGATSAWSCVTTAVTDRCSSTRFPSARSATPPTRSPITSAPRSTSPIGVTKRRWPSRSLPLRWVAPRRILRGEDPMNFDMQQFSTGDELAVMADQFGQLAVSLANGVDEPFTQQRLVEFAVRGIPGAEHASMTVVDGGRPPRTTAQSDELPYQWDQLQYEHGEGPCLEAAATNGFELVADLRTEIRWPLFARAIVNQTPVRSMLSFRLFLTEQNRAALNLYATRPGAFTDQSTATGSMFAAYASMALLAAARHDTTNHLTRALVTNREIGVAMGILMANGKLTSPQAFDQLRTASQTFNRKLRDIAADIALTGAVPPVILKLIKR